MGVSLLKVRGRATIKAKLRRGGREVVWNTDTRDPDEALRRATAELERREGLASRARTVFGRRSGSSAAPALEAPPATAPAPTTAEPSAPRGATLETLAAAAPPPPAGGAGPARRSLGESLARVLTAPATPAGASPPEGTPDGAPAQATKLDPAAKAAAKKAEEAEKTAHLFGRIGGRIVEGTLKWAIRQGDKIADDMDDDERRMIEDGFEEFGRKLFGTKEIPWWGKVLGGSTMAAWGMWLGAKDAPKKPAPLRLIEHPPPAQQQQRPAPEGAPPA